MGLLLGLAFVLALLAPRAVRSSVRVALRPITCATMSVLQRDHGLSAALRAELREHMEYCPSGSVFERMLKSPALEVERHFRQFTWLKSSSEREAVRQLENFLTSFSRSDKPTTQATVVAGAAGSAPSEEPHSSTERHESSSIPVVLQHSRRLAACSLPASGDRSVGSDCIQGSTVELTGNLKVYGTGDSIRTIDRERGGRHFTVGDGKTLTVERLHLINGAARTGCSNRDPGLCSGGIVHVSGKGAMLRFHDAWLSSGSGMHGGAVYAYGNAHVHLNRTSVISNTATSYVSVSLWLLRMANTLSFSPTHSRCSLLSALCSLLSDLPVSRNRKHPAHAHSNTVGGCS